MSERWRAVVGYKGSYEVSDLGRVRSLARHVPHKRHGTVFVRGRLMWGGKSRTNSRHYYDTVCLSNKNSRRTVKIHHLVAEAFLGPKPTGKFVYHGKNGIRDNRASNLYYGTQSQNCRDKIRDGTSGAKNVIRSDGKKFVSINAAARYMEGQAIHISRCCNGITNSSYGYNWKFENAN